ncbi:Sel1 repeat-containing protein [Candidatus Electrothrix aarhusensis]|uniref:Sel1 repeat-containing protein n=1 Tax=Candidatus Electrothrix aarhusensis TaxID=1859131 RepID=A0A3S3SLJ1_9BACT|nr:Sel1 repeat-containing protein [Candidatus Electrothrix aarhusensis]
MSFSKQHGMVKNIKKFIADLFRSSKKTASPAKLAQRDKGPSVEDNSNTLPPQEKSVQQTAPEEQPYSGGDSEDMAQGFLAAGFASSSSSRTDNAGNAVTTGNDSINHDQKNDQNKNRETYKQEKPEATPSDLVTGGLYAVQEQQEALYWLAKVIYIEEHVVHVVCYAERPEQLSSEITGQDLTVGLKREDGSFGIDHLPLPKSHFIADTVFLGQRPLTENDFAGYRIYADSVFDCLDEQAPDWLKKAGSYAAWRYDHNAMAALVDRYLIGVDLLRDSKKSLYWLNRLVHAGKGLVQPGESITEEQQILTGGIYACPQEDERYRICKVVLKDKHGVQKLDFPSLLGQLPEGLHPIGTVEQASARRAGKPPSLSHASLDASGFLAQSPLFLGLLPVTVDELHCYRAHLRKMFDGAEFRESAWDNLRKRATEGELQAQMDVAYRYIDGDSLWEVKRNIPEAIHCFSEAANQGHGLAAYTLALLFQQGEEGIPPDPKLGLEWLIYSAQLNYGLAQLHTADCYRQGRGCTANSALAHAWYSLAVSADNDLPADAKKRAEQRKNEIESTCSAEQMAEATQYFQELFQQLHKSS